MGDNSIKNSRIKILKAHTRILIIGRQFTKFQVNPMKDVRGVAETRSHGRTAGRTVGRTDGRTVLRTHGRTRVISIAPPPTSYIISNESDGRCRKSCRNKIMVGKV